MDLLDTPYSFRLSLDLPGVPREQIDIELDGRRLNIKAQRQNHDETDHKNLVRERGPVRFTALWFSQRQSTKMPLKPQL